MSPHPFGFSSILPEPSLCSLLGRLLCLLPCLTDLTIDARITFHDQLYEEVSAGASSSKNPYFRNNKHVVLLQEWSERKNQERWYLNLQQQKRELQQQQQHQQLFLRQQQQEQLLNNNGQYTNPYCRETLEQSYPSLLQIHRQRDGKVGIHAEPEYVQPFQRLMLDYPGSSSVPEPDPLTKKHLDEFDEYFQTYIFDQNNASFRHRSHFPYQTARYSLEEAGQHTERGPFHPVPHGLGKQSHLTMGQGAGPTDQTQNKHSSMTSSSEYINSCTSFYQERHSGIGMKPMYENNIPSTSGCNTAMGKGSSGLEGQTQNEQTSLASSQSSVDIRSTSGWKTAMGQGSSGLEYQTQNERTSLASSSSSDDDMPSTSGWKTTESRTETGLIESERAAKRIHCDSDDVEDSTDMTDESMKRSHGKRRAKTNREPTSP